MMWKRNAAKEKKKRSSEESSNGCIDEIAPELFEFFFALWMIHNLSTHYKPYPYADYSGDYFFEHDPSYFGGDVTRYESGSMKYSKPYYYSIEAGRQWARDEGSGGFVSLRGKFWKFFGPELEAWRLDDGEDKLDYYAVGLNIAIFQFDYFSLDYYGQYSRFKGVVDLKGYSNGGRITIYPGANLSLMLKAGALMYEHITFADYEGRVGYYINRVELFAGWRQIKSGAAELGGPIAGLKIML